jgi:asparagine synthase (glutamine-hydrolysing)
MCGLAGLFDIKGLRAFDPALLERMTQVIAHRGPDGAGHYLEPGVALGHRRLAIIDLSGGSQPMRSEDGRMTVVFNGEIYNFQELRGELEARGARFRTRSDTEVLLHGWRIWGEAMLPRLNGMFAFALWDADAQSLVLARDRFGKKPMHYALDEQGVLAFGSEMKSLLCAPSVRRTLDRTAVADFFAYGYVPDPKSIYRDVQKLPPAHLLIARRGRRPEVRAYWSLLDGAGRASEASAEALIERLSQAVRRRLVSDVPLGALLSGGVDSSAVVALMAEAGVEQARTFSIGFSEADYDESAYARLVAEAYGTRHETRQVSADDFSLLPRLPEIYDEPFGDVSAIPTFAVCALARRSVTVALTGDGGDEALAGYRRYRFHLAEERARRWLPAGLRGPVFGGLAAAWPRSPWLPQPLRAGSTLRELALDPASAYVRMVAALPDETRAALFSEDFRRELRGYDPGDIVRGHFNVEAPLDPLQRAQYADAMTYLPGDILTKVDRASMANSLELRSPMLDPEFFAWSLALPPEAKLDRRGGKALLKQGLESRLPADLLYRRKQGFTVPVARWFRGPLRAEVLGLASSPALIDDGSLDPDVVRRLAQAHVEGREDNAKALWLVWVFNAFLAQPAPARIRGSAEPGLRRPMPAQP